LLVSILKVLIILLNEAKFYIHLDAHIAYWQETHMSIRNQWIREANVPIFIFWEIQRCSYSPTVHKAKPFVQSQVLSGRFVKFIM